MNFLLFLFLLSYNSFLISTLNPNDEIDYLVLVNKKYKLPDDYESKVDLINATNYLPSPRTFEIERKAFEYYTQLRNKLLEENNIQIELDSVYRSVKRQQEIWDEFIEKYGEEYTISHVAVPGHSEHHTGLAIDICLVVNGTVIDDNDEMIAQREIFAKIHEKLADYGFILRYPEGKKYITGYDYEPWHLRFVLVDNAKAIKNQDVTLEEFLGKDDERYTDDITDDITDNLTDDLTDDTTDDTTDDITDDTTDDITDNRDKGYILDNNLLLFLVLIACLIF